jgi:NitT/TauT family transport system permease protein
LFLLLLLLWEAAVDLFGIKSYLIPSPAKVGRAIAQNGPELGGAMLLTAGAAVCGLALSLLTGALISFAFSQSRIIQRSFYPYAIFLQTVPIVAIAPLIILWFGSGFLSVVIVAFILSLFPIITNGTAGLTTVDRDLIDLFEVNNASRAEVLIKLRLPNSVPYFVTGVKTSSGLSVIGAIVGEFFAGYGTDRFGLGYLIVFTAGQLKTAYLFAAILASALLGLVIFGAASLVGNWIVSRWQET